MEDFFHKPMSNIFSTAIIYTVGSGYLTTTYLASYLYVTGFWKTERNVTLDLFHFIGPANIYTHTLPIHSGITRLSSFS